MHYIIYKTTNLINGRFYIGSHQTNNLDDGYLGSGKALRHAIKKYGKHNFKRETLVHCESRTAMYQKEGEIVNEDLIKDSQCYNLKLGGSGGWHYINSKGLSRVKSKEWIDKITKINRERAKTTISPWKGRKQTKEHIQNRVKAKKEYYKTHSSPMKGKTHSEEARRKISKAHKGKKVSKETRQKISKLKRERDLRAHPIPPREELIEAISTMTIKDAALKYKVTPKLFSKWLKESNIIHKYKRFKRLQPSTMSIEQLQKDINDMLLKDVAAKYNTHPHNLSRWIKKFNLKVPIRRHSGNTGQVSLSLKPSRNELQDMMSKMTVREITLHYGVSRGTVDHWIRGYDIVRPKRKKSPYKPHPELPTAEQLQLDINKMNPVELLVAYNISSGTFYKWCKKLNIKNPYPRNRRKE